MHRNGANSIYWIGDRSSWFKIRKYPYWFKNIALADLLEELKRNSSRWIKTKGTHYADFAWQGGYGGFSVSQSKVDVVKRYIENQKEHHKTETFKDEYIRFLKKHEIEYNEEYLWT